MKRWLTIPLLLVLSVLPALSGCSFQREPGPGERIGRALDDMRKGFDELAPAETADARRAREDKEWRRRQDEYYRSHPTSTGHNSGNPKDTDTSRTVDLYRDNTPAEAEQAERDREFWNRPAPPREENDRY